MSDKEFIDKIKMAMIAAKKHTYLVEELEREYVRRYGGHPSDRDDDFWIDTVHQGNRSIPTIEQIKENAELHSDRKTFR